MIVFNITTRLITNNNKVNQLMTKTKSSRQVNKNLFKGKMHLAGFSKLEELGKELSPPVSRFRICVIINSASPDYRLQQIATVLKSNVQTLFPKTTPEAGSVG